MSEKKAKEEKGTLIEAIKEEFPEAEVTTTEMQVYDGEIVDITPMDVNAMADTYKKMTQFVQKVMRPDVDYGIVPGTKKPSLYKPGAEKLQRFFGFSAPEKLSHCIEEWEKPVDPNSFPLFHYRYTVSIYAASGKLVSQCDGECNSYESKYRWRWVNADKVPEQWKDKCETQVGSEREPAFAINKKETTGQYGKPKEYWESWDEDIKNGKAKKITMKKRNGEDMDGYERDATVYRVPNEDIFSVVNTIMKMAQKRAYVGAVILAANASEYFTQDLEDNAPKNEENVATNIHMLVPNKDDMARKLMEYATTLGHGDGGEYIKKLLEDNNITWSLDNWEKILDLIEK